MATRNSGLIRTHTVRHTLERALCRRLALGCGVAVRPDGALGLKMGSEVFHGWDDFLAAGVGTSAALAGLLFVVVAVNLSSILKYPHLPARAIEALTTLLCVLVICSG